MSESTTIVVTCDPLTVDEEFDFLEDVNAAQLRGDITAEEAREMIDRQYELMAQA